MAREHLRKSKGRAPRFVHALEPWDEIPHIYSVCSTCDYVPHARVAVVLLLLPPRLLLLLLLLLLLRHVSRISYHDRSCTLVLHGFQPRHLKNYRGACMRCIPHKVRRLSRL